MLYTIGAEIEVYKELINKLQTEENREAVFREISELCDKCQPSSPSICTELCQIWKLKREFQGVFKAPAKSKSSLMDLLGIARNDRRLKILEILIEQSYPLERLRDLLKASDYHHSLRILSDHYIKPLLDEGFVKKEGDLYQITSHGKNIYTILKKSELTELPVDFKAYDEKVLIALASGSKSYEELSKIIPRGSLRSSLNRLQHRGLVYKSNQSGYIFYFKTKRRPTRRLSSTEMKIFKALPKEGITVRDLCGKVGISVRRVYRYLRRLRYKRHVKKAKKAVHYNLTDAGRSLEQSLNIARNIIQC